MSPAAFVPRLTNRVKDLLFLPGAGNRWRRKLRGKVMAFVYHRVDDPSRHAFLQQGGTPVIRPSELHDELVWLKSNGARFLTFSDLRRGEFPTSDEFGIIVSFDDGFADNYRQGLEVLDDLGIKGVLFQCGAMIGGQQLLPEHALYLFAWKPKTRALLKELAAEAGWPGVDHTDIALAVDRWVREVPAASLTTVVNRLQECFPTAELARVLYPSSADLQRAVDEGYEIGSHGHRHLHRASLTASGFEGDLKASVSAIEQAAGVRPKAFSYPFNAYRPGDREICARYFDQALTVDGTPIERDSDPLHMGRFSWPGEARNGLRKRRWLLTGTI